MTKENTLLLMRCKLHSFRTGYLRATAKNDEVAAEKWKNGYRAVQERIDKLKQD